MGGGEGKREEGRQGEGEGTIVNLADDKDLCFSGHTFELIPESIGYSHKYLKMNPPELFPELPASC